MIKEDIPVLNQLIRSLKEAESHLEEAQEKKDYANFNEIKKLMLKIQNTISKMLK